MILASYSVTNLRPIVALATATTGSSAPPSPPERREDDAGLSRLTARAFAEANRELWDNPEEDAAWADW